MKLIALTGGIASGKSTIAKRLSDLGAVHIDADALARDAIGPNSPGLSRVREIFGAEVFDASGSLDRAALGAKVFADAGLLAELEAIVHPEVRRLAQERIDEAVRADPHAIVVYDVPLLVEANVQMPWDLIVVTEAPVETRIARMIELRGMTLEEAERRISNQASDAERREVADVVIDTGGDIEYTLQQTDELYMRAISANQST